VGAGARLPYGTSGRQRTLSVLAAVADWRATMLGVVVLGMVAAAGVATMFPSVPLPPPTGLRDRHAPLRDRRVASAMGTTVLAPSRRWARTGSAWSVRCSWPSA
jgi:hypothetical protein